jgi:hypothetical protein
MSHIEPMCLFILIYTVFFYDVQTNDVIVFIDVIILYFVNILHFDWASFVSLFFFYTIFRDFMEISNSKTIRYKKELLTIQVSLSWWTISPQGYHPPSSRHGLLDTFFFLEIYSS